MAGDAADERERLREDVEDSWFRLLMHEVSVKEGHAFLAENESLRQEDGATPSREVFRAFERILKKSIRRPSKPRKAVPKAVTRICVGLLASVMVFVTSVLTVDAVRIRVLNFMIEVQQQCTTLTLQPDSPPPRPDCRRRPPRKEWSGCYEPTYIPEGYELADFKRYSVMSMISYENKDGKTIHYGQYGSSSSVSLDTENAKVEDITVNGYDGLLIEKGEYVSVAWNDGENIFTLLTMLDPQEALKMAWSVRMAP